MRLSDLSKLILQNGYNFFYRVYSHFFSFKKIQYRGKQFKLLTSTKNEVHRALTFASKEPETIDWIDSFASIFGSDNFIFFDIGANVGIYSLYVGCKYPSSRVYSFEPEAQSFSSLVKNIFANNFSCITPFQIALSKNCSLNTLFVHSLNAGAGAAALGSHYQFINDKCKKSFIQQGVFTCSLDQLIFDFHLPVPNFIKIDVDGLESEIIYSSKKLFSDEKLLSLLVEVQYEKEDDLKKIIGFLFECGLKIHRKSDWISSFGALSSRNFIFYRQN